VRRRSHNRASHSAPWSRSTGLSIGAPVVSAMTMQERCSATSATRPGCTCTRWIPDGYYDAVVIPRIKGRTALAIGQRSLAGFYFDHSAFPDQVAVINGVFLDRGYSVLTPTEVEALLFADSDRVIFKQDGVDQGRGVHVIRRANFDADALRRLGDGVVQRFVEQHADLAAFHGSVATLRLTTAVEPSGEITLRAAYLRFGVAEDAFIRQASSVKVAVDLKSGRLLGSGYLPDWRPIDRHPTTGLEFSGLPIPSFREAATLAIALHGRVPFLGCLGWDVSVDTHGGVEVLEVNTGHNGITFNETMQGPCFLGLGWEQFARASTT